MAAGICTHTLPALKPMGPFVHHYSQEALHFFIYAMQTREHRLSNLSIHLVCMAFDRGGLNQLLLKF